MKNTDVVLLCGGRGERLGSLTEKTPKPLLDVGGKPFLARLLERFHQEGFERFILAAHYLSEHFIAFAKTYATYFPNLKIIIEKEPLGTGGALKYAALHVQSDSFVALNADTFVTQPIKPVLEFHLRKKNVFTLTAVQAEHVEGVVFNKGGLEINDNNELLSFNGHVRHEEAWVNGGLYVVDKKKILSWPQGFFNLEGRLDSLLTPNKATVFRSEAFLLDIGTPECFEIAQKKYANHSLSPC